MLKAFTPVSTMLFGFLFRLEQPSAPLIAAVSLTAIGVSTASYGEGNLSFLGVAAMLASILCEGLRLVLMQFLLAKKSFHPLEALMYLAPAAAFWMSVMAGAFEAVHIHQAQQWDNVAGHKLSLAASGLAGFGVNAMAIVVVSLASALTLKVLGICKDVGLVLWGVLAMGNKVSQLQVIGYSISLLGVVWYNSIKAAQGAVAAAKKALPEKEKGAAV
jgi:drug/metabolite transporter (DMT)-like permease